MIAYIVFTGLLGAIVLSTQGIIHGAFTKNGSQDIPTYTLSLILGIPLFLILFSLVARIIPGYHLALPLTLTILALAGRWASRGLPKLPASSRRSDRVCILFASGLFLAIYLLRINWPAIHWENSVQRIGVERMFNLSMQQSFLFGRGWPVENLWLYGEPLDYHVLLRVLSGLMGWLARALSGNGMTGGIIYLLVDVLYLTLAPTALLATLLVIVPRLYPTSDLKKLSVVAPLLSLLAFLTPNGKALYNGALFTLTKTGSNDFWAMQHAIVPGTVSYFPYGLLLSGESHSYALAPFLSISWLGLALLYSIGPKKLPLTLLMGMLCAMIAQSHPATAMVCGVITLPLLIWDALAPLLRRQAGAYRNLGHSALLVAVAGLCMLPTLSEHLAPNMRWVWISNQLASRVPDFASVHLLSSLLLVIAGGLILQRSLGNTDRSPLQRWTLLLLSIGALLAIVLLPRPIITISLISIGIALALFGRTRPIATCATVGAFLVWIFPEVLVTDWVYDNRTDWIRFNTAMRFWLESTYLFPLAITALIFPELCSALRGARTCAVSTTMAALFTAVVGLSLYSLTAARIARAPERSSIDGFQFLRDEHQVDYQIIWYLNQLPTPVVVGEACGDGSLPVLPYHYGQPGRISAFSGRPSLCGWARHTWMFQQRLRNANPANETIWQSFLSVGEHFKTLVTTKGSSDEERAAIGKALTYLKQRGITHIVIGELEKQAYPTADPEDLARRVNGRLLLAPAPGFGVVALQ